MSVNSQQIQHSWQPPAIWKKIDHEAQLPIHPFY
jgi:hypothetical protein